MFLQDKHATAAVLQIVSECPDHHSLDSLQQQTGVSVSALGCHGSATFIWELKVSSLRDLKAATHQAADGVFKVHQTTAMTVNKQKMEISN